MLAQNKGRLNSKVKTRCNNALNLFRQTTKFGNSAIVFNIISATTFINITTFFSFSTVARELARAVQKKWKIFHILTIVRLHFHSSLYVWMSLMCRSSSLSSSSFNESRSNFASYILRINVKFIIKTTLRTV